MTLLVGLVGGLELVSLAAVIGGLTLERLTPAAHEALGGPRLRRLITAGVPVFWQALWAETAASHLPRSTAGRRAMARPGPAVEPDSGGKRVSARRHPAQRQVDPAAARH